MDKKITEISQLFFYLTDFETTIEIDETVYEEDDPYGLEFYTMIREKLEERDE